MRRAGRWIAPTLGALYLLLLAAHFPAVVATANLDADTVSAPVIGALFGGPHWHGGVVLGTFGWYASLLFELGTRWLPAHRQLWETGPYALALAGCALTAWPVWRIAGAWAAGITAVLLACAAPPTLHLLLSMTQHAPDWFACALLSAYLVAIERRAAAIRWPLLAAASVAVGVIVGVNAASDLLAVIAGLGPFVLGLTAAQSLARTRSSARALQAAALMLVCVAIAWVATDVAMSAMSVGPQPGLNNSKLASGAQIVTNLGLWWRSIAALGNGVYAVHAASLRSVLGVTCTALALAAIALLPWIGLLELLRGLRARRDRAVAAVPGRLALVVFWSCSAMLLTGAFIFSGLPIDVHADRYLVGLIYAAAALIPLAAARRHVLRVAVTAGACVFALSAIASQLRGDYTSNTERFPSTHLADQVLAAARAQHLRYGYAGYWDAAAITWATHLRARVFPVSICDQNQRLCRFDLHFIANWYRPRPGVGSFLLVDPAQPLIPGPTPDLGPPVRILRVGRLRMYVYGYDLAARIVS